MYSEKEKYKLEKLIITTSQEEITHRKGYEDAKYFFESRTFEGKESNVEIFFNFMDTVFQNYQSSIYTAIENCSQKK